MDKAASSKFVGIKEAAEFLGVSYSVVWESLRRGDFPVANVQIGTEWRISRAGLEALAAAPATENTADQRPKRRARQRRELGTRGKG